MNSENVSGLKFYNVQNILTKMMQLLNSLCKNHLKDNSKLFELEEGACGSSKFFSTCPLFSVSFIAGRGLVVESYDVLHTSVVSQNKGMNTSSSLSYTMAMHPTSAPEYSPQADGTILHRACLLADHVLNIFFQFIFQKPPCKYLSFAKH